MIYEECKVVGMIKPLTEYKKRYVICTKSSNFWVVYDETNNIYYARSIVENLESRGDECIVVRNPKRK